MLEHGETDNEEKHMLFIDKLFNVFKPKSTMSIDEASEKLRRTEELAEIANKTTDRAIFYSSIKEIKDILRELSAYEGKLPFIGSPSNDLRNLEEIEQKQIELLEKRIEEMYKPESHAEKAFNILTRHNIVTGALDEYFAKAGRFIIEKEIASIGLIQRVFKIGFNRAARILDQLCEAGVVGEEEGTKPRKILMSAEEFEQFIDGIEEEKNENAKEVIEPKLTLNEIECIIKDRIGIDADYSHDGESLKSLKNIIVPSVSNEKQLEFINLLLKHNSPETLKLILIDDSIIAYSVYNGIPHLLIPVITEQKKAVAAVSWCCAEMKERINKFVDCGAKRIDSYNEKMRGTGEYVLPRIVVIVNEANEFFRNISEPLERVFMNSSIVGMYFILFSRFSVKSLSLGMIGELLEVYTPERLQALLCKNERTHTHITRDFDNMDGHQFEEFCANILRKNSFKDVEVTQGSGDQGIDIIAYKDGIKYGIQCKCYTQDIGNKAVQEAFSGKKYYDCHVAAVLTNRYFTQSAKELSAKNGVLLWDRGYLEKLLGSGE